MPRGPATALWLGATAAALGLACCCTAAGPPTACPAGFQLRAGNLSTPLAPLETWAACENLQSGAIAFVRSQGQTTLLTLQKRLAPNWVDDTAAYLNFTKTAVLAAPGDLLGGHLLSQSVGFTLQDVAAAVPPIRGKLTSNPLCFDY